ncbi:MAG: hydantoinase/oxoprolinase family protein [Rhodospirillaceae bacterium]|jgi:N-methylhydantoinase A|nr:hydantoinase/oxoprolinase family protein [Rhodospirillaceae bacterium]MBT5838219.1 hydantoinase/oxoprolinase family protein [Rhodospirillaceae bacterium]MBT7569335.1 hydantoinase/oxoprolinase family protein [Rhodospirillaceae bacterium]
MTQALSVRLAADIGGTFTDIAAFDEETGRLSFGKKLSTPDALVDGIEMGVGEAGIKFADANLFLHGTTVAINTILERTGANTALVITEGFRDVYEIGRVNRPDAYNLFFKKHVPLVERALRFEINERMYAEGEVYRPLIDAEVEALAEKLGAMGIEATAILFLHSYRNPDHEIRAKAIFERVNPGMFVTVSHELSQEYREFERVSTVAANAYIGPKVRSYLNGIEERISAEGFGGSFLVVQSTGGLYEVAQAKNDCVHMLESGPAAGVIGTKALCDVLEIEDAISFDMGGTTAKSGVISGGVPLTTGSALIGGYDQALPIQVAMMDIAEVGTGGGSIAHLSDGGSLRVGPESAGARPGPVCYGLGGTEPTVTDANLVLGRLAADRFLGGDMQLDASAAEAAIKKRIADPLGMDVIAAADGILKIAATAMSYAVKAVSTERGLDAASFAMVAIGGAGPLHASDVAREIGMGRIIIPQAPGHFSAFGMLFSDLRYDYVRTWPIRLADADFGDIEPIYAEMEDAGRAAIERTSINAGETVIQRAADMRYVGQEHAVTVDLSLAYFSNQDRDGIKAEFDRVHEIRYGTSAPAEQAEIVSLRSAVTGTMQKPPLEPIEAGAEAPVDAAKAGSRRIYFGEETGFVDTPAYNRSHFLAGNRIEGPAVIDEHASTTLIEPGDFAIVDAYGNLVISVHGINAEMAAERRDSAS